MWPAPRSVMKVKTSVCLPSEELFAKGFFGLKIETSCLEQISSDITSDKSGPSRAPLLPDLKPDMEMQVE